MNELRPSQTRLFGPFRLSLREQVLFEGDRPLPLRGRALDVLLALTDQPGELVSKNDLLARVWPDVHVEEAALRVHISALRKLLGPSPSGGQYIANVAGRGYKFIGEIVETLDALSGAFSPGSQTLAGFRRTEGRIVGRSAVIENLIDELPVRRLITITGPGGMGKTTVALSVAAGMADRYRDGVQFIDLTTLSDATLVLQKVASTLQLQGLSFNSEADLVAAIRNWQMLIVLDNCEHLIAPAALLAERILAGAPDVHILTTSREPLRAAGEWVWRLPPLDLPPLTGASDPARVLSCSAAALFLERAHAANASFALTETDIPSLVDICHRLDGIPLAIELAAARVDLVGLPVLARLLKESFSLLTAGLRTALPRQQTLRATLDWSYDLLTGDEQILLERLALFRGVFTLEAAAAVAAVHDEASPLLDGMAALVAKSLMIANPQPQHACYRLLETTRDYALEKLVDHGEHDDVQSRHADYFHRLLGRAEIDWPTMAESEWLGVYAHTIADVRVAIDWLLKQEGRAVQGAALTGLASVLWFALGAMEDYRSLAQRALDAMADRAPDHAATEMRLTTWLGAAIYATLGPVPQMAANYTRAADLAAELGDPEYQLYALWGLAAYHNISGNYDEHLKVCRRFDVVTEQFDIAAGRLVRDRIMASALYFVGQLTDARAYGERALRTPPLPSRSINRRFHEFEHHLASRVQLSRILWLEGFADRAAGLVREAVEQADLSRYSPGACFLLAYAACPIALWSGDLPTADRYLRLLTELTANRPQNYWRGWRECYAAVMELPNGDTKDAATPALIKIAGPVRLEMAATLREDLVGPVALQRVQNSRMLWCAPEIWRAQAVLMLKADTADAIARAEEMLQRSLAIACEQGALAWQLRTATTLALHYENSSRDRDARSLLTPIYEKFSEGFDTADLQRAATLLSRL